MKKFYIIFGIMIVASLIYSDETNQIQIPEISTEAVTVEQVNIILSELMKSAEPTNNLLVLNVIDKYSAKLLNSDGALDGNLLQLIISYYNTLPEPDPNMEITEENMNQFHSNPKFKSFMIIALGGGNRGEDIVDQALNSSNPRMKSMGQAAQYFIERDRKQRERLQEIEKEKLE